MITSKSKSAKKSKSTPDKKQASKKSPAKSNHSKKELPKKSTNVKIEDLVIKHETSISDQSYFNILSANGEIVATSEMYSTEQARNKTAQMLCDNFKSCTIKLEE